jgi:hypothetical protein
MSPLGAERCEWDELSQLADSWEKCQKMTRSRIKGNRETEREDAI